MYGAVIQYDPDIVGSQGIHHLGILLGRSAIDLDQHLASVASSDPVAAGKDHQSRRRIDP